MIDGSPRSPRGSPAVIPPSESGGSIIASIAVHVAVGALLVWLLSIPYPRRDLLSRHKTAQPAEEHPPTSTSNSPPEERRQRCALVEMGAPSTASSPPRRQAPVVTAEVPRHSAVESADGPR
jgi:hypothetical protein